MALLALASCTTEIHTLHPNDVAHESGILHRDGKAPFIVQPVVATRYLRPDSAVEAQLDDSSDPVKVTVGDLLTNCPTVGFDLGDVAATHPQCRLLSTRGRQLIVEREHHMRWGWVIAGAAGGLVGCTIACDSPWNYVSGGTLAVAGTAALVGMGVLLWAMTRAH
jgi:hypothetical protein